ncbi:MAG TPA: serine hydrolase [Longimicrobiales bacterium]
MRNTPVMVFFLFLWACAGTPGPAPESPEGGGAVARTAAPPAAGAFDRLEEMLRARIGREAPAEVAVALVDLGTGERLGIADTVVMHAASTMKVPVLLELVRQAETGRFSLDARVPVVNEFTSIADGSTYSLSPEDDSETALYGRVGERVSLRELARLMIVRSSNLATNNLIAHVTADSIARTLARLDAAGMRVLRGVEDGPAYRRGMNNTTTAAAFARVLEAIARCEVVSRRGCEEIVEVLAAQEFNEMIPAGLPAGTRVAHKTGWITGIHHDGGIIYPPGRAPYVLVVLTRGFQQQEASARVGAEISRMVWDALVGTAGRRADVTAPPLPGRPGEGKAGEPRVREEAGWTPPAEVSEDVAELLALHDRYRLPALEEREFTHAEYWGAVGPIVDGAGNLSREEVGRSAEGRPLYLVRFGSGPTTVLLWSQMHGDESTATMALADIFHLFARNPTAPRVRALAERLTVLFIPMLNPDGAERFQRRNAQGIDVNRDARRLATPEAQTLKAVRDRYRPAFGFNLHDQNVRTRVGSTDRLAAIALLAPRPNATREESPGQLRAKKVAATIRAAIEPLVPGHIARYDDTFNPRAFGDLMQSWGTSTVLIESGGWQDDPEKQYLRRVNFVAILTALGAIATGAYEQADVAAYETLLENGRAVNDLLVLGGTVVVPGLPPYRADLAVNFEEPLERRGGRIVEIGDLAELEARDTIDARGLFVHPLPAALADAPGGGRWIRVGAPASFALRRGPEARSEAVQVVEAGAPVRD